MPVRPVRALVVEADDYQRMLAISKLQKLGCQVIFSARDGAQGVEILHKVGPVDIVLCDLRLNGMDGLAFLRQAARARLIRSVIINEPLTDDARQAAHRMVTLLGLVVLGDLNKPLQLDSLEKSLQNHLCKVKESEAVASPPVALCDVKEVQQAMRRQQLKVYFQPKVYLSSGKAYGVELLTLWHHPIKGVLPPAAYMPALKEAGLIDELLTRQLNQGLGFQRVAWGRGHFLNLALNLSPEQLSSIELVQTIKQRLADHRLPASGLTFGLAQSTLLQSCVIGFENLIRLRVIGGGLSVDKFGAHFSSFKCLSHLPFTEIKLDGELVRDLALGPCRQVVSSTLALGRELKLWVVVEGISTPEQYQQLTQLGCVKGQGCIFAGPMLQRDMLRWLDTQSLARKTCH